LKKSAIQKNSLLNSLLAGNWFHGQDQRAEAPGPESPLREGAKALSWSRLFCDMNTNVRLADQEALPGLKLELEARTSGASTRI
jgi:hypothetical protein